jgi:nitroreductase
VKAKIYEEADRRRQWALETSGWKWLDTYRVDFLKQVPVIIAVVGDPKKTGVDMFMEEGMVGYQLACAAAIQNLHLAAFSFGLSILWHTLFDKQAIREILGIDATKNLVSLGKKEGEPAPVPRKNVKGKTTYIR